MWRGPEGRGSLVADGRGCARSSGDSQEPERRGAEGALAGSGQPGSSLEPGGLGQAEHQVQVLERLARGALQQVVDGAGHHDLGPDGLDPDHAAVGVLDLAQLGLLALGEDGDEGLVRVASGQGRADRARVDAARSA